MYIGLLRLLVSVDFGYVYGETSPTIPHMSHEEIVDAEEVQVEVELPVEV